MTPFHSIRRRSTRRVFPLIISKPKQSGLPCPQSFGCSFASLRTSAQDRPGAWEPLQLIHCGVLIIAVASIALMLAACSTPRVVPIPAVQTTSTAVPATPAPDRRPLTTDRPTTRPPTADRPTTRPPTTDRRPPTTPTTSTTPTTRLPDAESSRQRELSAPTTPTTPTTRLPDAESSRQRELSAPTTPTTPTTTATPAPQPKGQPTLGYYDSFLLLTATPATPVPTPAPRIQLDEDVVNILLLGIDREVNNSFRTDTIIVLSIRKSSGTVSMLSIPRDLYVYIPQVKMQRINTAANYGQIIGYPGGGPSLLIQTLLYNLGIPIHHYASIDFDGFAQAVDTLGGIDVPVLCEVDDYIRKDVSVGWEVTDNLERFTVPVGIQHMDGASALHYVRLRQFYRVVNKEVPRVGRPADDFERARRQQQILRAIYRKGLSLDIVPQIPALFAQFSRVVVTDMGLGDVLQFVPLATKVRDLDIKSRFISQYYTIPWTTPEGETVRLPDPQRLPGLLHEVFSAPSGNQLQRAGQKTEVVNRSSNPDWDLLAVDRLTWAGFNAVVGQSDGTHADETTLIDYTTSAKGSALNSLLKELKLSESQVIAQPDADSPVHFRLILGNDYDTCGR